MEEHKELENLMDKLFEADTLESPSMGFTNQVRSRIEALKDSKFEYKPLLPKWTFFAVGIVALLCVWYVLTSTQSGISEPGYLQRIDASGLISNVIDQLNFSSSWGYALLAIGVMLCVQAVIYTKHLHRRLV